MLAHRSRNVLLAVVLALVAAPAFADPAGGLQPPITVPSSYVPARTVQVWLPPGYAASERRYPVLYLLHGSFGTYHDWLDNGAEQIVGAHHHEQ